MIKVTAIAIISFAVGFFSGQMVEMPKTGNAILSDKTVYDIYLCNNDGDCMDKISEEALQARTAKELLAELDMIGQTDSDVLLQCHPITHSIGRMLYKKVLEEGGHLGDTFQQCDHTCHSGCFHGTMERLFFSDDTIGVPHVTPDVLKEKAPKVCEIFGYGTEGNIKFQCLHGLGHAVMFFTDYNLTESLNICDLLPSQWDETSCYGGAFMENVFAANKSKRYLTGDPHFPCNAIDKKYQSDCYIMQTSRMYELGLDSEDIGRECENAGIYKHQCMQSLGRDLSSDARIDPNSVTICTNLSTPTDNQYCITGMVYALADNSWDGTYAFPYCDTLPEEYTEYCYGTVIDYMLNSIFIPKSTISDSCEKYSSYSKCKSTILS